MDSHISIVEQPKCAKDSQYLIHKEIKIDHSNFQIQTPFKILDGRWIGIDDAKKIIGKLDNPAFEFARRIEHRYPSWKKLNYLLTDAGKEKTSGLNSIFSLRQNLYDEFPTTVSMVFCDNPFVRKKFQITEEGKKGKVKKNVTLEGLDLESYIALLDYIHTASKLLVLSPDLEIKEYPPVTLPTYLDFIDRNMTELAKRNNKPIFAPLQIQLSEKQIEKILIHYKSKGYVNIWVNFNGCQLGGLNFWSVRNLIGKLDRRLGLGNVSLYYSHIKKEFMAHQRTDSAISSDIMPQFFASDFIGVNQNPLKGGSEEDRRKNIKERIKKGEFKDEEEYKQICLMNRNRIFDPGSYYYYVMKKYPRTLPYDSNVLSVEEVNRLINGVLLRREMDNTRNFLINNNEKIKPYLKKKKALTDNPKVLEELVIEGQSPEQKHLFEKFGKALIGMYPK